MKKLFAILALVLGMVSCQKDFAVENESRGEVSVQLAVAAPELIGATRTDGDAQNTLNSAYGAIDYLDGNATGNRQNWSKVDLRYSLEVYDEANPTEPIKDRMVIIKDKYEPVTFELRLIPNRDYRFVVFADFVDNGLAGTTVNPHADVQKDLGLRHTINGNLTNITIKQNVDNINDELADAYFKTFSYKPTNSSTNKADDVILQRPYAKVRVVATDLAELNLNVEPKYVYVNYDNNSFIPTTFNAVTGDISVDKNSSDKEFDYTYVEKIRANRVDHVYNADYDAKTVTADNGEVRASHLTLFTDYILATGAQAPISFQMTVCDENNDPIKTVNFNTNIPVQRNYLTTIVGNVLTAATEVTVTIDDNFANAGTPEERPFYQVAVSTGYEFVQAFYEDREIILQGNITVTEDDVNAYKNATRSTTAINPVLNLNGFTIKFVNNGNDALLTVAEGSSLTIEDNVGRGAVVLEGDGNAIENNGTINIEGGSVVSNDNGTVIVNKGEANISGGELNEGAIENNGKANISGGELNDGAIVNNGTTNVTDGKINEGAITNTGNGTTSITGGEFTYTPDDKDVNDDYEVKTDEDGNTTIVRKDDVAKIGEVGYTSLAKAVAAVEDGQTITLIANEKFTAKNRTHNSGTWYDGLYYVGDKSFTIDLGGFTIDQDGAVNDYLLNFKNDGAKASTITLKNGTIDAGTTAYCAFATSSSNKQKITINLENINLVGNNSNGAVAKIRGGAELNVKSGTVITGNNNYVGIEAVGNNTVVNIYDNVKIYQNGTSSYVGAIVGASYNATMNIYGGYGKSAKCGIIVMSTGATINVSGGEWIANNDGTVATDNNAVLVSQNNRYETGWACKSILNVTGGTFKGGYNCYGMGPGVEPDDAQINIKGGNFNADPASYVVAGYEAVEENGGYTVGKPQALVDFEDAIAKGGNVTLSADITLLESVKVEGKVVVLDLNGKTVTAPLFSAFEVKAGAELTIKNGKVVAYESTVRAIDGKAIIESGEYTSTGTALDSPSTYRYSLDCREGGELIINGGTFKSNNGMINVGSTVTINGGKFENIVEKSMTRHFAYVSAPLTINDGEFYGKANSAAGGCFFCGAAAGGDIQVNGGKFTSLWTSGSANRIFEVYFGGTINVTGGMFNTNGGIATFVTENTDEATKAAYPYVAK